MLRKRVVDWVMAVFVVDNPSTRTVVVIHRGRGTKWEVVFQEHVADVVMTTTTDLLRMTATMLTWLRGGALAADEDSLHAIAG